MRDLTGMKFNRYFVVGFSHRKNRNYFWKCKCDCGNERIVSSCGLTTGRSKSCGCLRDETAKLLKVKHGKSKDKLYKILLHMKARCYNPNHKHYKYYGARGITICDDWKNDFVSFYNWAIQNGYDERLTIDRINNDFGYFPDNCRWVTRKEQSRNTRRNKLITFNGETKCLTDWAIDYGIDPKTLSSRIKVLKWELDKALSSKHQLFVKKVICVETGEIFNSMTEASEKTKVNVSNICAVCNGKRKTTGGYHWKYID